ncbi:MAG: FliM/FliN family flagellar motor switch protein [Sedimentisphaerales bacterium]|nr:FliM/FliN family flagellar motor switch protein [Sedimentisphaerales bacterium]
MADQDSQPIEPQEESAAPVESADSDAATSTQEPRAAESAEYNPERIQQLLDMKAPVIAKVAQRSLTVKAVMRLRLGSIIQFEKDAYDHIELMVNNRTIGLGQPVKIGENFGLRLVQVGDVNDMIRSLGAEED